MIKILVVDDEEMIRMNLKDFLEDEGFICETVESGEAGLEIIKNKSFDAAVVDMRLPGIDGNQFIIEAHKMKPEMKYLIHTGSSSYYIPDELKDIGICHSFLFIKPVKNMTLIGDALRLIVEGVKK